MSKRYYCVEFAELFSDNKEIQFACYCKALSLNTPEEYLVKLRQIFAKELIERQLYNEAKTEIQSCASERKRQGWKINNQLVKWTGEDWYKSAEANQDNTNLYSQHLAKAEEILYRDLPEETIVVEFVNKSKKVLNFVKNKEKYGFSSYSGLVDMPRIGDILRVRFDGEGQNGFYRVLSAKNPGQDASSEAIKEITGVVQIKSPNKFGFVSNVFVESKIIEANMLSDGQKVIGKAIISFNKKKNEWGWKAINLKQL